MPIGMQCRLSIKPATTPNCPPATRNALRPIHPASRAMPAVWASLVGSKSSAHESPETLPRIPPAHALALITSATAVPIASPTMSSPKIKKGTGHDGTAADPAAVMAVGMATTASAATSARRIRIESPGKIGRVLKPTAPAIRASTPAIVRATALNSCA